MAKKNHHPVSAEVENNPLYHDTYKLLRCYRDSTYSLMVAVRQVEIQFQLEYNTSIDEFLDSIYAAGADLGDSQIEEWAKSIARSNKMIKLLLSSVDLPTGRITEEGRLLLTLLAAYYGDFLQRGHWKL